MAIPETLSSLLTAVGPSGHEGPALERWRVAASAFATVSVDRLGTSYARVGPETPAGSLALIGHVDEIGFQVTHVGEDGLLAFSTLGGMRADTLVGQRVLISGRAGPVPGVVGRRTSEQKRSAKRSAVAHSDLHIDLGADGHEAASALVEPGDAGVWQGDPLELAGGRVASRALDNRLGAYVVLEATRRVVEAGGCPFELVAVASVQEEVGSAGARAAAFALDPTAAIVIDVTFATDVPGGDSKRVGSVDLGGGPTIARGPVVSARIGELLLAAARAEGIPFQLEVYSHATSTDADAVYDARGGVPTGLVSIPLRYMHSPSELASLDDIEATVRLLSSFALALSPDETFVR